MAIDSQRAPRSTQRRSDEGWLGCWKELRAQVKTACLPVIALTAQHGETEEKAWDLGAHHYPSEPVKTRSLGARVRTLPERVSS